MTILAVLENEQAIPSLNTMMAKLQPEADLLCFGSALPALAAARKTEIDIAIVDVKLPELDDTYEKKAHDAAMEMVLGRRWKKKTSG